VCLSIADYTVIYMLYIYAKISLIFLSQTRFIATTMAIKVI